MFPHSQGLTWLFAMVGSRAKGDVCVRGQTGADLHGDTQDEDLEEQHHLSQA